MKPEKYCTRADLEEMRHRQDARWVESKKVTPLRLPDVPPLAAGGSPTHFITCGGYSAFICAPWIDGALDTLSLSTDFRRAVCAAVGGGNPSAVGACRMFDLSNSHNPDFYDGCYVLREEVAGGADVVVIPQEGVTADKTAACERRFREHFTVVRMETLLTTVWLNSVAQGMAEHGVFTEETREGADARINAALGVDSADYLCGEPDAEHRPTARRGR